MRNVVLPLVALASVASLSCAADGSDRQPPVAPAVTSSAKTNPLPVSDAALHPPAAKKEPHVEVVHGQRRVDDYWWLRQKGAPEVVSYLEAENAYTEAMTKGAAPLRETLYKEMVGRIKETDLGVPVRRGAYSYYSRTEQGKQYPIYCREPFPKPKQAVEEVLLDLNELGRSSKYIGLGDYEISDDGNTLAYSLDVSGFRQYSLYVKDLRSGKVGSENIPRVTSTAFAKDGKTLFYVTEDPQTKRSNKLFRHVIGEDVAKDPLVYEEKDEMFDLDVSRSRSKEYVFASSESKTTTEVRVFSAAQPAREPKVFSPREHGHRYYVDHGGGTFYVRTDAGARNFRLMTTPVSDTRREKWKEIVAHSDKVMIEGIMVFDGHYATFEREDGLLHLRITDTNGGASHRVEMPESVYALFPEANPEFGSKQVRFNYQSLTQSSSVFDYDVKTKKRTLLKQEEVLGGYDPANYESKRLYATARDGTKIPLSVVHKKGLAPGAPHPTYLSAYGSYGASTQPYFNSKRVSLMDRGIVVVLAHIRGGGDLGKKWHDDGRMMNKMNTFTDFIDSADYLVKEKWTASDRLVIEGGSAGGLLMGAVTNMRPELFKAVLAHVPFVDVINTMLDETLPLTVSEFEEWGNPKVKEQYEYMMRYSPYDNVTAKAYPAILVKTSYNDSQVMYWEPAKYVAKLRAAKTDKNVLLLKTNMEPAGHGGQSGRYNRLREIAFDYAFMLEQLGLANAK